MKIQLLSREKNTPQFTYFGSCMGACEGQFGFKHFAINDQRFYFPHSFGLCFPLVFLLLAALEPVMVSHLYSGFMKCHLWPGLVGGGEDPDSPLFEPKSLPSLAS